MNMAHTMYIYVHYFIVNIWRCSTCYNSNIAIDKMTTYSSSRTEHPDKHSATCRALPNGIECAKSVAENEKIFNGDASCVPSPTPEAPLDL